MNLDSFEHEMEKKILERGYQYYQDGHIRSLKETEAGLYQAEVEGNARYRIYVELAEDNTILASECDCPYDLGEFCKHEAAVYFALRERKSEVQEQQVIPMPKSRQDPKKEAIKKMLEKASQEALADFLLMLAEESEELKTRIELAFGDENDQQEVKRCRKLIQSYIDKNSDRHGFIGYDQMWEALKGTELVLEKSRDVLGKGKAVQAVRLALLVIGEAVDMTQYGDDSDGGIGVAVGDGFEVLDEVREELEDLTETERKEIFALIMEEADNRRYRGWIDCQIDLLRRSAGFIVTPAERERMENCLKKLITASQKDSWTSEYLNENILLIQYELHCRFEGEAQATAFLNKHLNYSKFREMAIHQAMGEGDEARIIQLCLEGEEKDKGYSGLLNRWREHRYQSYIRTGQLDNRRSLALEFVEEGSFQHYQDLKSTYSTDQWSDVYPKLIERLAGRKRDHRGIYAQILVEEQEWERLMQYVFANPHSIDSYYKYLMAEYREEVCRIFQHNIEQAAALANTRSHYRGVCATIRTLQKAGGKKEARDVVQSLLLKYPRRPAFRDELNKLKL
ncbi:hypothetical protein DesLBE_1384 [Desulfitobacterium sp. LBE]|uniref:SWIM zinc finger domain protein n=3 Tax=root TaxID=1 RepID=A0A098B434_DESHA|nr:MULTISPECIES: hypothetical protein [Desulfitobacterium]TWH57122.1 hypothetical protein DesLBE_1384 [Desulfitobacterium sp. LBE]CDX03604.1 SWIM zinc finger domain protein [Desulfitobacterium hafniense]